HTATPGGRNLIEVGIAAVFAAESRDLSLLWVLYYTRCGTNESSPPDINRLFNTPNGAQDSRIVGGSQRIAIEMAKRLGNRVLLDQPVRRISQGRSGVTVVSDHLTVSAKRVIVTGPPALTAQIYYEPQLPADRAQL